MYQFLNGAIMFACLLVGAIFWRAYRRSVDRLFAYFALSFFILAAESIILAFLDAPETSSPYAYVPRLAAFLLIIVAIVEKNRGRRF
jgi:4-amino-4-deoxy-L-arabinose transferase-like glycosyltransferase